MPFLIPTRGDIPFYDEQVVLDGVVYTLQFRWNVRANAWFMGIFDETGETAYATGLKLVVEYPFLAFRASRTPPGALVCVDTSGAGRDIEQIDELGGRVQLYYITSDELAEA